MEFDIITLFPDQIEDFTKHGLLRIALEAKSIKINIHDLRDWTTNKHRTVDDRPYGGGAGMIIQIEPVDKALEEIRKEKSVVLLPTPRGEVLDQKLIRELASDVDSHYVIIAGHYEALDERIHQHLVDREISVGDYVLSGGELPTLTIVDAIARLQPGVLGNEESEVDESFENGLLEYPHYTRPEKYKDWSVPEILLTGDHGKIKEWRKKKSVEITRERRPDLIN